jgi:NDP-sugar pyrophosphorylase family protein
MNKSDFLKKIDTLILCGGLGRRLGTITKDLPKPMAMIGDKPFLKVLVERLSSFGLSRFILCVGYKKETIEDFFRLSKDDTEIVFSEEDEANLLGTGGAVKNAESFIRSETFLVMNGDSCVSMDFEKFLDFHRNKGAIATIALTKSDNREDAGSVRLGEEDEVLSFREKDAVGKESYMNAGVYAFDKKIFSCMPSAMSFSVEYDLFPYLIDRGIYGYTINTEVVDIGTPERLEKARLFLTGVNKR